MSSFKPSLFPIYKVYATGNYFLLIDLLTPELQEVWKGEWQSHKRADLVRLWCDRHDGLGADGLVILEPQTGFDFAWDFYNSDGGSAEMCGNATRAVSLYFQQTYGKMQVRFQSSVGAVEATVHSPDKITVQLPKILETYWKLKTNAQTEFDLIRPGVPHAVVRVPSIADSDHLIELAAEIKSEPRFQAQGVNVTFVELKSQDQIRSVTFERGVEDFTLACGTGAIAAAHSVVHDSGKPLDVSVPGGLLRVEWSQHHPVLIGPAKIVAQMQWIQVQPLAKTET